MGQVGTGKTHSLFGSSIAPAADQDLCTQILSTLFSRIRQADIPQDLSVFLSMWDVVTGAKFPCFNSTKVQILTQDRTRLPLYVGRGGRRRVGCRGRA